MSKVLVTERTLSIVEQLAAHIKAVSDKKVQENGEESESTVGEYFTSRSFSEHIEGLALLTSIAEKGLVIKELSLEDTVRIINTLSILEIAVKEMGYPVNYEF